MDINIMRYFLEVAKTGNITQAAKNLCITQPTLTRQLAALEKEMGFKLFFRNPHGIRLTGAGEDFQAQVQKVVLLTEATIARYANTNTAMEGDLNIGLTSDAVSTRILNAILMFNTVYPNVKLHFHNGTNHLIRKLFSENKLDLGIMIYDSVDLSSLDYINLNETRPLGLIMRSDDRLAVKHSVDSSELYNLEIFAPDELRISRIKNELAFDYDKLNIFATFDAPINYIEFIRFGGKYMLCFKPSNKDVLKDDLVFRTITPAYSVNVGILKSENTDNKMIVDAFVSQVKKSLYID